MFLELQCVANVKKKHFKKFVEILIHCIFATQ